MIATTTLNFKLARTTMKRLAAFMAGLFMAATALAVTLDLSGEWGLRLDANDQGISNRWWNAEFTDTIHLPGTTAIARKGNPLQLTPALDKTSLQHLHQKYSYIGPAWYERVVEVPADWRDKEIELILERVIWETRVWINGVPMGMRDSLSTPHRYDITSAIKPGKNRICMRVDNRKKLEIGVGHAYSEETQTVWNGVVGRMELQALERVHIEQVEIQPDLQRGGVHITLSTRNNTGKPLNAWISVAVSPDNFRKPFSKALRRHIKLETGSAGQSLFLPMGNDYELWSEFNPKVYSMEIGLNAGKHFKSSLRKTFGMREIKAEGRKILLNGKPTFLRGTLECCIFPETAYPAMTEAKWDKIFATMKEYGLNHVRFHSWCPPEAAFRSADRQGIYIQVELPNWSFKMGQVPEVDAFFRTEGERIVREYGSHPSWVLFSMGNELVGDFEWIDGLVAHLRALAPGLLFTSTSYSFAAGGSPRGLLPGPQDDYFISMETKSGWVRGQGFLNQTKPNTVSDYSEGLACLSVPLISHEVGQYNVFPNLAELPKYDSGPLRALGFEAIQADLATKGRLAEAAHYTRDSGKLAALLYKEDIERALRTKDQAGIALLDLHDFPGQSTATVGLLDAFWDSKGLITPEAFRRFCAPTVPLVRMAKMVFQNDEVFEAGVEIAHFGLEPLSQARLVWNLNDGDHVLAQGEFRPRDIPLGNAIAVGHIRHRLDAVHRASELKLTVEIANSNIANDWKIWVYPRETEKVGNDTLIFEGFEEPLFQALREGRKVLFMPARSALKAPIDGRFIPVFWSPLHFPNQPGTLGATIDADHPLWSSFPTSTHTDWQWWELLRQSYAVDLNAVLPKPAMPFRFVDKFNRNALPAAIFEARIGTGRLLVCTLDISSDLGNRIAARQLRRSLLQYMDSPGFEPSTQWSEEILKSLASDAKFNVAASSASASYPPELAIDGDVKTFWHTDWDHGPALPAHFDLDLRHEALLSGFTYVPRADMRNGRIGHYAIAISRDGKNWEEVRAGGVFPNTTEKQIVQFPAPVKARFFRLIAKTDLGESNNAAIAELVPLITETNADVRELGIVPGFNDAK